MEGSRLPLFFFREPNTRTQGGAKGMEEDKDILDLEELWEEEELEDQFLDSL